MYFVFPQMLAANYIWFGDVYFCIQDRDPRKLELACYRLRSVMTNNFLFQFYNFRSLIITRLLVKQNKLGIESPEEQGKSESK